MSYKIRDLMITLIPEISIDGTSADKYLDSDRGYSNKQSNNDFPPFDIRELEDLRNLVLYASTHLEKLILSSKLEPQTVEEIEKLENKITKALSDLSSYKSNNDEIDQKISSQNKAFRIRDLMITILMDSEPCDAGCSHGGSTPCPAGAESHEPPPPPPPPPPPSVALTPGPAPVLSPAPAPDSPRRELVDLRGLLEHAILRLGRKQTLETQTPQNSNDVEALKKKLEGALESLQAMKEKFKPK